MSAASSVGGGSTFLTAGDILPSLPLVGTRRGLSNGCSHSFSAYRRSSSARPCLLTTGFRLSQEEIETVESALNVSVVDLWHPDVKYCVVGGTRSAQVSVQNDGTTNTNNAMARFQRSIKLMCSSAWPGSELVDEAWLRESLDSRVVRRAGLMLRSEQSERPLQERLGAWLQCTYGYRLRKTESHESPILQSETRCECVYLYPSVLKKGDEGILLQLLVTALGAKVLKSFPRAGVGRRTLWGQDPGRNNSPKERRVIFIGDARDSEHAESKSIELFSPELLYEASMRRALNFEAHRVGRRPSACAVVEDSNSHAADASLPLMDVT